MKMKPSLLIFLSICCLVTVAPARHEKRKRCRATQVNAFQGNSHLCGDIGMLTSPSVINTTDYYYKFAQQDCADLCLSQSDCLSWSWQTMHNNDPIGGNCTTYNQTLEAQGFQDMHFQNDDGHVSTENIAFYDRKCWSTNCATIKTCAIDCHGTFGLEKSAFTTFGSLDPGSTYFTEYNPGQGYYGYSTDINYEMYGCGIGITARDLGDGTVTKTLPGDLHKCEAILQCIEYVEEQPGRPHGSNIDYTRSMNVFYYIPSEQWICKGFKDEKAFEGVGRTTGDYWTIRYHTHTGHDRFSVENSSVGASYAYYPWAYAAYYSGGS